LCALDSHQTDIIRLNLFIVSYVEKSTRELYRMFKSSRLALICVIIAQGHAGKPATCTPEYEAMSPQSTMCWKDSDLIESTGVSKADIKVILDTHNNFRASVSPPATNMVKLVWDKKVAKVAQKLSQQCKMFHDENRRVPSYPGVHIGQNVAAGQKDWETAVAGWHNEVNNFEYGKGSSNGKGYGHYTQVVDSRAMRIGCGYTKCTHYGNAKFYVCNYAAGQLGGLKPYTVGSESACPNNTKDGLCDCGGLLCLNKGKVDVNTCQCICPKAFGGKTCNKELVCRGKTCFNKGKLDKETCECNCKEGTSGKECEKIKDGAGTVCSDKKKSCKKATEEKCGKGKFKKNCCASCAQFD